MKKKACGGNRTVGYFTGFGSVAQLAVVVFLIVEQTLNHRNIDIARIEG